MSNVRTILLLWYVSTAKGIIVQFHWFRNRWETHETVPGVSWRKSWKLSISHHWSGQSNPFQRIDPGLFSLWTPTGLLDEVGMFWLQYFLSLLCSYVSDIESEDPRLCVLNAVDSKFTHGLVSPRWICFHGSSDGAANKWILKVSYGSFDSAVPLPMDANTDGLCLRNIGSQRCLSDVVKLWSIRHIVDWYYDQSSGGSTFIVSGEYQINTNFWLQKMDGWLPHHFNTSLESTTIDSSRHWDSEPEVDDWFFVQWPLDQKLPQV